MFLIISGVGLWHGHELWEHSYSIMINLASLFNLNSCNQWKKTQQPWPKIALLVGGPPQAQSPCLGTNFNQGCKMMCGVVEYDEH